MEIKNIDAKLKKELEITKPLREFPYKQEIEAEMIKAWESSKYRGRPNSSTLVDKFRKELIDTNYEKAPRLKQLLDEVKKIYEKSMYIKFPYSKQSEDFALAHVKLTYNDDKIVEPLADHYEGLVRTNMKSVSVISESGKELFTLDIVNDKLIYRLRNMNPPIVDQEELAKLAHSNYDSMNFENPKRCFLLETDGKIIFVWDSGEVVEISNYSEVRPYNKPELIPEELATL